MRRGGQDLANLIYSAFKHKRISTELPSIHISAGLHATVRLDERRKYKPGDCEDFRHATAALPYYDIFCTDSSLKHLVCTKPLELHEAYGTTVVSDDDELLDALSRLT